MFSFRPGVVRGWTPGQSSLVPRLNLGNAASEDRSVENPNDVNMLQVHQSQKFKREKAQTNLRKRQPAISWTLPQATKLRAQGMQPSRENETSTVPRQHESAQPRKSMRSQRASEPKANVGHASEPTNMQTIARGPVRAAGVSEKAADLAVACLVISVVILISCCVAVILDFDLKDYGIDRKLLEGVKSRLSPSQTPVEALAAIEDAHGTWIENYKTAKGKPKIALELLLRCSIIPVEEFAHRCVSQDYIDDCIWIATHMLRTRSLDEWALRSDEARGTFKESVASCFQAQAAMLNVKDKAVTRQTILDEALTSEEGNVENLLVTRCREILASRLPA